MNDTSVYKVPSIGGIPQQHDYCGTNVGIRPPKYILCVGHNLCGCEPNANDDMHTPVNTFCDEFFLLLLLLRICCNVSEPVDWGRGGHRNQLHILQWVACICSVYFSVNSFARENARVVYGGSGQSMHT